MLYSDHQAELGQSFDPYKWDRKLVPENISQTPIPHGKDSDSGYQSGDINNHSKPHSDLTQSNSPDISSDHESQDYFAKNHYPNPSKNSSIYYKQPYKHKKRKSKHQVH